MNIFVVVLIIVGPALIWMLFHNQNHNFSLLWRLRLISVVFVLLWLMGQISEKLQIIFPSDRDSPLSVVVFGVSAVALLVILIAPSWDTNGVYVNNTQRYVALLLLVVMAVFDGLLVVSFRHSAGHARPDIAMGYQFNQTRIAIGEIWSKIRSYKINSL